MKSKKIRGHHRIHKQIDSWRVQNLSLNLNDYLLNGNLPFYTKINIHPWNGISFTNSSTPPPNGKTKQKMLQALLDIYENWKNQLDKLGQPYYLKIWLYQPRFSLSQVVCAIGKNIDLYKYTFYNPESNQSILLENYGSLKTKLSQLDWEYRLDEDHLDNSELNESKKYDSAKEFEVTKNRFHRLLKKPHRTHQLKISMGDITETYSFKRGDIWLGEKK